MGNLYLEMNSMGMPKHCSHLYSLNRSHNYNSVEASRSMILFLWVASPGHLVEVTHWLSTSFSPLSILQISLLPYSATPTSAQSSFQVKPHTFSHRHPIQHPYGYWAPLIARHYASLPWRDRLLAPGESHFPGSNIESSGQELPNCISTTLVLYETLIDSLYQTRFWN